MSFIIGKLTVAYLRGVERNDKDDVIVPGAEATASAIVNVGGATADGGIVRGLGTRYISAEAKAAAERCAVNEREIRSAFEREFMRSPIPGTYVLPDADAGERLLSRQTLVDGVTARVAVYDMSPRGGLPPVEIQEWTQRIKKQLQAAPLGRAEGAGAEGIEVLAKLASCPLLAEETRMALNGLIAQARLDKINRVDLKRRVADLPVTLAVQQAVAPRRAPSSPELSPAAQ